MIIVKCLDIFLLLHIVYLSSYVHKAPIAFWNFGTI